VADRFEGGVEEGYGVADVAESEGVLAGEVALGDDEELLGGDAGGGREDELLEVGVGVVAGAGRVVGEDPPADVDRRGAGVVELDAVVAGLELVDDELAAGVAGGGVEEAAGAAGEGAGGEAELLAGVGAELLAVADLVALELVVAAGDAGGLVGGAEGEVAGLPGAGAVGDATIGDGRVGALDDELVDDDAAGVGEGEGLLLARC
jgi:hypothetical protein